MYVGRLLLDDQVVAGGVQLIADLEAQIAILVGGVPQPVFSHTLCLLYSTVSRQLYSTACRQRSQVFLEIFNKNLMIEHYLFHNTHNHSDDALNYLQILKEKIFA